MIVRRVSSRWIDCLADDQIKDELPIPAWACNLFSPSSEEEDEISIYVVDSESAVHELAAAWSAMLDSTSGTTWAVLDEAEAKLSGLSWDLDGQGQTAAKHVNAWHANLKVATALDVEVCVRAFAKGSVVICDKKPTEAALEAAVKGDRINLVAPEKGRAGSNPYKKVPKWAAEGWVRVTGLEA